jgi:hypothetical protein
MREPRRLITLEASSACYRDSFSFFFPFAVKAKLRFQVPLRNLRNYKTRVGRNVQFREFAAKSSFLNILSRHRFGKEGARAEVRYSHPLLREHLKREGTRDNLFRPEAMFSPLWPLLLSDANVARIWRDVLCPVRKFAPMKPIGKLRLHGLVVPQVAIVFLSHFMHSLKIRKYTHREWTLGGGGGGSFTFTSIKQNCTK